MSGLVVNELIPVDVTLLKKKQITITRYNQGCLGIRNWYVLFDENDISYQRYSLMMNPTDEVLFVAKVGDVIELEFYENSAEDVTYKTFESFTRNVIVSAKFV
ncbi:MAG: hypothetical protein ACXW2E_01405 [Nitrososphaeraceae archaeon]